MTESRLLLSRRSLIGGLASTGGLLLSGCSRSNDPPTYGNILRMGDNLTYHAQRLLLSGGALAREYDRSEISSMPAIGTVDPAFGAGGDAYGAVRRDGFADWRIEVSGSVDRPRSFSLPDLRCMRSRTQITRHMCEEGWTAITEWTGVPLSAVLAAVAIRSTARFVEYYSFDGWADSIDMIDALHPQTLLAYGMNGRDLPIAHGAPVRMRVERQIGYKSVKFLQRIVVSDHFNDFGKASAIQQGWAWHAGI
ncbi:DMSO/TMAO reductase YedYZ, molybdopterin-dependent catalytic subunit [Sphingomonas sp. YR710]|uniref:molybdopterin-dependent oxidoreductase n=1 Tax=Sphingomonas sp. YR710 TaxID=1882773 RepID=UPI00088E0E79|nr:molybdopterin-dependent oxidoreductase [Sphingomonas sp. YR710]SDC92989.1 DMSO/TMAO reductase YedYZ, molybdopterin-dependent catalytic subunit [Sphingomonas sp. YR710]